MKDVTIYSTPTCHFCHITKEFLNKHNIPFTDYNVAIDLDKRKEMVDKSGQMGVPVIVIGDELMVGFNEEKLKAALSI